MTTDERKYFLKQCFIDCFKYPKSPTSDGQIVDTTMTDEEYAIIHDLWRCAGPAGLAKILEDCGPQDGWQVTNVTPVPRMALQGEPAWNVCAQYRDTGQIHWTHITGTEILKWQMGRAAKSDLIKLLRVRIVQREQEKIEVYA